MTNPSHEPKYDHDEIAKLVSWGIPQRQIARLLGCAQSVVSRVVAKHPELRQRESAKPMTSLELCKAKELLEDGAPCEEVGRTLGRSGRVIRRYFPEYAWTMEQQREFARTMRNHGKILD